MKEGDGDARTVLLKRNPSIHGAKETGIGIIFGRPEAGPESAGPYRIHKVLTDGTAFQSGSISAGDLLLKVNGVEVIGLTAERVTALLKGNPSSPVKITISTPTTQDQPYSSVSNPSTLQGLISSAQPLHTIGLRTGRSKEGHVGILDSLGLDDDRGGMSPPGSHIRSSSSPISMTALSSVSHLSPIHPYTHYNSLISQPPVQFVRTPPPDTGSLQSPPPMPVLREPLPRESQLGQLFIGEHQLLTNLRFEETRHLGLVIDPSGKAASNHGGAYWSCLRITPAIPPVGKYCAFFQITSQSLGITNKDFTKRDLGGAFEGCGSLIGVCDPERHNPAKRRGMGSEHAWMVSLRTGTRFHNGKDLPAPLASPAPAGSEMAVMIDMDSKVTYIQVNGESPGAIFNGIPNYPGGVLSIAIDLCRGDVIEILPRP